MQIGNGSLGHVERVIDAFVTQFGGTRTLAVVTIAAVLERARDVKLPRHGSRPDGVEAATNGDDVILPCTLCEPDWIPWWQQNYGSFWEAARWLHCGPLGNDCPGFE